MIWLLLGAASVGIGVALWLLAGVSPLEFSLGEIAADAGWPFALFLSGLFYGSFVFGAYCVWKAVKERTETSEETDA